MGTPRGGMAGAGNWWRRGAEAYCRGPGKTALNRPRIHHRCDGEPDTNVIFWSAT